MHGIGSIIILGIKTCPQIAKGGATNIILLDYCFENLNVHWFESHRFWKNNLSLLKYHRQVKNVALNGIQDNYL